MKSLLLKMFRRSRRMTPDPVALQEKLRNIRDLGKSEPPIDSEDVTAVIQLAVEELRKTTQRGTEETRKAAERMRRTSESVAASVSPPPED